MNVAVILKAKGRAVTTARPDATVQDIAEKLAAKKIGAVVIIGEGGRIAGIASERDLVRAIATKGAACLSEPVSNFMTSGVVTCDEADQLGRVMSVMTAGRFRHLPVLSEDALVGIVSIGDVVKHHVAEVEMEASAMRDYLTAG